MRKAAYSFFCFLLVAGGFLAGSWHNQRPAGGSHSMAGGKTLRYACPMHPQYTSDKPGAAPCCGMPLEPIRAGGGPVSWTANDGASHPRGTVKVDTEQQQLIGVRVSRVEEVSAARTIRLYGRVAPDETKVYRLTAGVDGWIGDVSPVTTGSRVAKGQYLASFSAQDLFVSVQAYVFALTSGDRLVNSAQINPTLSNMRQRIERLHSLGMSDQQIEEIRRTREIPESIKLFAPAAGFVLARNVSPGQRFDKGAEWYRIADLGRVWILADVFENDAQYLRPGMRVQVSLPNRSVTLPARVGGVLPQFDASTRTLKVRLEAENPGYALRPDMFVDVNLPVSIPPTIAISMDAVLDSGLQKTVFVARGEGLFEPRVVKTGRRFGDKVEILGGLQPGEQIANSGNFLLDSESRMKTVELHNKTIADPVCGMKVDEEEAKAAARMSEYRGTAYYFCSDDCKRKFSGDLGRYVPQYRAAAVFQPGPK